jgi:solute carrier family 6 amino acid transporter-like protein 5/7/9/14
MFEAKVWFAAITQVFFSLNIFFGCIFMYSSYNKFDHNVLRDANIVTTLDTFTSLLAGCCIFGIIGHLAHELGIEDVSLVVKNGPGLAFISYPDAISKFKFVPQIFSALFFLMLFLLGVGSIVAMTTCVTTLIRDQFKDVKNWQAALGFCILGTVSGSIYLTPVRLKQTK